MMTPKHLELSRPFVAVCTGVLLCLCVALCTAGQTATHATKPATPTEPQASIQSLELGNPIERALAGGQAHNYQIALTSGQFLHLVVERTGVDVVVRLLGPDGKQLLELGSAGETQGETPLTFIADAAGVYHVTVFSPEQAAPVGTYKILVNELRAATDNDRALQDAAALNQEAERLHDAGKYDEALPLAERALAIRETTLGTTHPDVATSLDNLAWLYEAKADYARAELLYIRALTIREHTLGPEHPSTADSLNDLALLYDAQGNYAKEEPLLIRALTIYESTRGKEHPDTALSLNNLAMLYRAKGDYLTAEPLLIRAVAIFDKTIGDQPDTAISLNNLVSCHASNRG